MSLQESGQSVIRKPDVYIAPLGEGTNREAARLARELRQHDLVVELGDESFRLKKSFDAATKLGARYVLIVGENEVKSDTFALKNQEDGQQTSVPRAEIAKYLQARRNGS
jgi:histidyl-tRNA synthetase